MSLKLAGYVNLRKLEKYDLVNSYNDPVAVERHLDFNFFVKGYDIEKYEFRVLINYRYIIPSTISTTSRTDKEQDVVVTIEIFGKNKLTNEDVGYLQIKNINYNLTRELLEDRVKLSILIFNQSYKNVVAKQGIFKDVSKLETKIDLKKFPPQDWGFFFY